MTVGNGNARVGRRRGLAVLAAAVALGLFATACGDDGSGDDTPAAPGDGTSTSEASAEPTVGGTATVVLFNEVAGLDPVTMLGTAGGAGQRAFALYGALVAYDSERGGLEPVLAESLDASADGTTWTLTLRKGLVFSDGSSFDAAAVKANWERAKVPANRSPAAGVAATIGALDVVDAQTLRITLTAANAQFANAVSRTPLNYIASAKAITDGVDLTSKPVGAGPFLLDEWVRDDHMTLVRNPDWYDAPRPYLDEVTFRVIADEDQRVDTMLTGGADLAFSGVDGSVARALNEGAAGYAGVTLSSGRSLTLNTTKAPLDDVRVRQALSLAIDKDALADVTFGEGSKPAHNYIADGSMWQADDGVIEGVDTDAAQTLIDEVIAQKGGPLRITIGSFQTTQDQAVAKFVQTSLMQLDGIEVEVSVVDSPTATTRVLQGDYQIHTWGYPVLDPDPSLFAAVRSGQVTNYSRYANPDVDAALDAARLSSDDDERLDLYREVYAAMVEDVPFIPLVHNTNGFLYNGDVAGARVYEDGIIRLDLVGHR